MRIPFDAVIADSKLVDYLLVLRPWDDKCKYLAQAGFKQANAELLESAIRRLAAESDAVEDGKNDFGTFWRVDGGLTGPNGILLPVTTIWLEWSSNGTFHFITLKPRREKQ
ncbi:MAG TPA: hypothetical protein VHV55_03815 [Pirellulales bacterium]|jgi:hypothetical protein|nr:hypothetical protein [Pirellulales bacterium]